MTDFLKKFIPIWEVETHFKCPVIGAILSVEKHQQILKKCGYDTRGVKPYEYHQILMSKLSEKNNVSIKVNNYLKSNARKYMLAVHGKSDREIRNLWKEQAVLGNVGPLMYAIVSYEDTSLELLHDVYGEIHMQELVDGFGALNIMGPSEVGDCPADSCSGENCTEVKCAQYQICAKRIFMVGGITKMKPYYREIVEKAGGKFDYHDGYLKNSTANLEARVKRSDLVICPVNCNSHNACLKVKKLCKQHNKQLKILSSSSLSAITHALFKQEHETILN